MTPLCLAGDGQCLKCQSLGTPDIYLLTIDRCAPNGNSWCCGGPPEGRENCCATNSTTSLEPYPFSTIDRSGRSAIAGTSLLSTATLSTSPLFSSLTNTAALTPLSTTAATPRTSVISLTGSLVSTTLQNSSTVPTSLAQAPTAKPDNDTILGIAVGVPLAIVIVLLAVVAFFLYQLIRKHKLGFFHLQHAAKGTPLPEMDAIGPQSLAELDITHYELNHPDAPRHELHPDTPRHELP